MNTEFVISFKHANFKTDDGVHREILIAKPLIFATYFSDKDKATHIVSSGGAIIPVLEAPDEVAQLCGYTLNKNEKGD